MYTSKYKYGSCKQWIDKDFVMTSSALQNLESGIEDESQMRADGQCSSCEFLSNCSTCLQRYCKSLLWPIINWLELNMRFLRLWLKIKEDRNKTKNLLSLGWDVAGATILAIQQSENAWKADSEDRLPSVYRLIRRIRIENGITGLVRTLTSACLVFTTATRTQLASTNGELSNANATR